MTYDSDADVLYITKRLHGTDYKKYLTSEHPKDHEFLLRSYDGNIVGVTLIGARILGSESYYEHPAREDLPLWLDSLILKWYKNNDFSEIM